MKVWSVVVSLALTSSAIVVADDYLVVTRSSQIRTQPDGDAPVLESAPTGTELVLLNDGIQSNGYYQVAAPTSGTPGWIYRNRARRYSAAAPLVETPAFAPSPQLDNRVVSNLCYHGCPNSTSTQNVLVVRQIYLLSNNPTTKFADWVAYRLDAHTVSGPSVSARDWKADPLLPPEETLEPDDYEDANDTLRTDRGHQAPLASFKGTAHAFDTNFLSNITPQKSDLNQGPWKRLEDLERDLAKSAEVYVLTGPLYADESLTLPRADEVHRVPSGYWKVIAIGAQDMGETRAVAFIFPQNTPRSAVFNDYIVSVDVVEAATGLNFFWSMEDTLEETVEAEANSRWLSSE